MVSMWWPFTPHFLQIAASDNASQATEHPNTCGLW